ncbi:hypothetical protein DITRI_Ditri10aG0056400 [Diplodiscus trichospermus]
MSEEEEMERVFRDYFTELFTSVDPSRIRNHLSDLDHLIIPNMNKELDKEFTEAEIVLALNQMAPNKAPGPNRITTSFC